MKEHDPLCPEFGKDYGECFSESFSNAFCQCTLISEVRENERVYVISVIEDLPCLCDEGRDYCDGHTDAINAIEAVDNEQP